VVFREDSDREPAPLKNSKGSAPTPAPAPVPALAPEAPFPALLSPPVPIPPVPVPLAGEADVAAEFQSPARGSGLSRQLSLIGKRTWNPVIQAGEETPAGPWLPCQSVPVPAVPVPAVCVLSLNAGCTGTEGAMETASGPCWFDLGGCLPGRSHRAEAGRDGIGDRAPEPAREEE